MQAVDFKAVRSGKDWRIKKEKRFDFSTYQSVTLSHELVTYRSKDEHLAVYVLHKHELVITIWHMLTQNIVDLLYSNSTSHSWSPDSCDKYNCITVFNNNMQRIPWGIQRAPPLTRSSNSTSCQVLTLPPVRCCWQLWSTTFVESLAWTLPQLCRPV